MFVSFFSCLGLRVDLLVLKFTLGASLLLTPSYRRIKVVKLKLKKKKKKNSGRGKWGHCLSTHMVECEMHRLQVMPLRPLMFRVEKCSLGKGGY